MPAISESGNYRSEILVENALDTATDYLLPQSLRKTCLPELERCVAKMRDPRGILAA
jgi:hypothetical protein